MEKEIKTHYLELDSVEELSNTDALLLAQAKEAAKDAYAPYSEFRVGAAVLLSSGRMILGNNQENIAFPSGLCAERVALFAANANYPNEPIRTIAISALSSVKKLNTPIFPCGSCLQVLSEYETLAKQKIKIILQGMEGKIFVMEGIETLMPFAFRK